MAEPVETRRNPGERAVGSRDGGSTRQGEHERHGRLKYRERDVLVVGELPDEVVAAIEAAGYGALPR